jgi:hypothetical protein
MRNCSPPAVSGAKLQPILSDLFRPLYRDERRRISSRKAAMTNATCCGLVVAALTAGFSGCASAHEAPKYRTSSAAAGGYVTAAASPSFYSAANRTCIRFHREEVALSISPQASNAEASRILARDLSYHRREVAALRRLTPPAEVVSVYRHYLTTAVRLNAIMANFVLAQRRGDSNAILDMAPQFGALKLTLRTDAMRARLPACGRYP